MERFKTETVEEKEKIHPSSIGSRADMKAGVDISKVHGGYFSSQENAKTFLDVGVETVAEDLPQEVRYADFGGGQGFLTKSVADYLESKGHEVKPVVADANGKYLEKARELGMETLLCNLESCDLKNFDLVTMRAVNHYNTIEKQQEILNNVFKSLGENGHLISQISSGSKENCQLRSDLVNLDSLGRAASGEKYRWMSIEEYIELLKKANFSENNIVGYAPPCSWEPEEQWDRFNLKITNEAEDNGDIKLLEKIKERKDLFLKEAYDIIKEYLEKHSEEELGIKFNEGKNTVVHYKYPIIDSKK